MKTRTRLDGSRVIHSLAIDERRDEWRRLIPQLIGEQCYLVFSSELGLHCHGGLAGLTAIGLSALIGQAMPDAYRGPLPAIAVVDDHLRDGSYSPEGSAMVFDAIVLHELSHIVTNSVTPEMCAVPDPESLRDLVQADWREWKSHSGSLRWIGHDSRFIRVLIHLWSRMRSRGHWTSLALAFSHKSYGLASAERYRLALGDEPGDFDFRPIGEITALPMPPKFQKLWTDDVVRSLSSVQVSKGKK